MERRLAKFVFAPKTKEDHLIQLPTGAKTLGVGYSGGASLQLLVELPTGDFSIERSPEMQTRSFRRFGVGDVVPSSYKYVGHARVGPDWVFIYERVKP